MSQFVITCIAHGTDLSDAQVDGLKAQLQTASPECKISQVDRLSANATDLHLQTEGSFSLDQLKSRVKDVIDGSKDMDVILQRDDQHRRKKLVVFDMDSTLIYQEVVEMIASYAGVEDEVREATNRAMNGELDFEQALRERLQQLKGLEIEPLYKAIKPKLHITRGVPELCQNLKARGVKLAVLSGGFLPFANYIKDQLQLDFAQANVLEVSQDGRLTGGIIGELVDGDCKARTLKKLCEKYGIAVEDSMMVGDGGNDLPAMAVAGLGVAWHGKPRVQELAPCKLNTDSMIEMLHILGYSK